MNFPDIMVDIETTGTQPERTNMIQLAAVRFNLKTGDVDTNFFDRCLLPLPTRFWDEDTRTWWSKMPKILDGIWGRMEPPAKVMQDFGRWAGHENEAETLHFWGKPISFDYAFVASYFRDMGQINPFHFRMAQDQNTFIRARYFPEDPPPIEKEIEFMGDAHNALHDALHQVRVVLEAYERTR